MGKISTGVKGGKPHSVDSSALFGVVDADATLAELEIGQAYHFHTAFGAVTLSSAGEIGQAVDGDLVASPVGVNLSIPQGVTGWMHKTTSGVLVSYSSTPEPDAVFDVAQVITNTFPSDLSDYLDTNDIQPNGIIQGHTRTQLTVNNGGDQYTTIIDGVASPNITTDTVIPPGTIYTVTRDSSSLRRPIISFNTSSQNNTTFVTSGVLVQSFPDWEGDELVAQNAVPNTVINTGVDLNEVDILEFSYTLNNDEQLVRGSIDLRDFPFDVNNGALVHWWDNQGIRLRINATELATGEIRMSMLNNSAHLKRIEFRKYAVVEEGKDVLFSAPLTTNTVGTLDNGITWQDVKDKYDHLVLSLLRSDGLVLSDIISLADFADNQILGVALGNTHANLGSTADRLNFADGEFHFQTNSNSFSAANLTICGVKPHGRVSTLLGVSSGVQTVTGSAVDNTDPLNPLVNLPEDTIINQQFAGSIVPTNQLPSSIIGWEDVDDTLPTEYFNSDLLISFFRQGAGNWISKWIFQDTTWNVPTDFPTLEDALQQLYVMRIHGGAELTIRLAAGVTHTLDSEIFPHQDLNKVIIEGNNANLPTGLQFTGTAANVAGSPYYANNAEFAAGLATNLGVINTHYGNTQLAINTSTAGRALDNLRFRNLHIHSNVLSDWFDSCRIKFERCTYSGIQRLRFWGQGFLDASTSLIAAHADNSGWLDLQDYASVKCGSMHTTSGVRMDRDSNKMYMINASADYCRNIIPSRFNNNLGRGQVTIINSSITGCSDTAISLHLGKLYLNNVAITGGRFHSVQAQTINVECRRCTFTNTAGGFVGSDGANITVNNVTLNNVFGDLIQLNGDTSVASVDDPTIPTNPPIGPNPNSSRVAIG